MKQIEDIINLKESPERLNFYRLQDVANILKISLHTVRRAVHSGTLKAYNVGSTHSPQYRITEEDLLLYITRHDPDGMNRIIEQRKEMLARKNELKARQLIKLYSDRASTIR